jgi:hypothetical protein
VFFATLGHARGMGLGEPKAYADAYAAACLYGAAATAAAWVLMRRLAR